MKITIYKVSTKAMQCYIGIATRPKSKEYDLIKTCKGVKWTASIKLWLLPYTTEHWGIFKKLFHEYTIDIEEGEVILHEQTINSKSKSLKIAQNMMPKRTLNEDQYNALLKLKEQLIIKQYSNHTMKNYCSSFIEFMLYHYDKKVTSLLEEDIRRYLLFKINNHNISESTQNSIVNAIKFYYEKVELRDRFSIRDLRPKPKNSLPGFLSKEEVTILLKSIENLKHKAILRLIYSSGMRLGELTRLKINDVKFDQHLINIRGGKGKKDRMTLLSPKVKVLLIEYISAYNPKYYLFEGQTGGKYSDRSVQRIMQKAVIKSGVDPDATVHTLRHSFATHMVLNGVNLKAVQEYLGHASSETTEVYVHLSDKLKSEIKSPIDDLDI